MFFPLSHCPEARRQNLARFRRRSALGRESAESRIRHLDHRTQGCFVRSTRICLTLVFPARRSAAAHLVHGRDSRGSCDLRQTGGRTAARCHDRRIDLSLGETLPVARLSAHSLVPGSGCARRRHLGRGDHCQDQRRRAGGEFTRAAAQSLLVSVDCAHSV